MDVEKFRLHSVGKGELTRKIALRARSGKTTGCVWLGGFKSDMLGTKAQAMVDWASAKSRSSLRFDYSGHGESEGKFTDGTISNWVEESFSVIREFAPGRQVLVGSSMGGWIALRLVQEFAKQKCETKITGLILIAPAPDFTSVLMQPAMTPTQRDQLAQQGYIEEESEYSDEPTIITKRLIEDGELNLVLGSRLPADFPIRILQGTDDPDVPYAHAMKTMECIDAEDITITLIKGGDHRLSRSSDITLLTKTLDELTM